MKNARTVAGIFVSAAIAAYGPPAAWRPQIVIAIIRPPRSRAVFAATGSKYRDDQQVGFNCGTRHILAVGENPHTAMELVV